MLHLLLHHLVSLLTVQETNIYLEVLYQNSLLPDVEVLSVNMVETLVWIECVLKCSNLRVSHIGRIFANFIPNEF